MKTTAIPRATHEGTLTFGSVRIACAVLRDRRRIVNARDLARMFGLSGTDERSMLRDLVRAPEIVELLNAPVEYRAKDGETAYGYEATLLPDICIAIVEAHRDVPDGPVRGAVDLARGIVRTLIARGLQIGAAL